MSNALLFSLCSLIWGSTWMAIGYQINAVDTTVAVAWRFTLAALCLGIICVVRRLPMRFSFNLHLRMATVGLLLYCLNYSLLYYAQHYIVSALLALMSTCIIYFNVLLRRWWYGHPIRLEVVAGATVGGSGMALLFVPEFQQLAINDGLILGVTLAMLSFLLAATGNVMSERILLKQVPVMTMNFYAMSYALLFLYPSALLQDAAFVLPSAPSFYLSLFYLAIVGTVAAFGLYMQLLKQMGADKAAYVVLVYPLVALVLSTLFEGYQWTVFSALGVVVVIVGSALAMGKIPLPRRQS